MSHHKSYYRVVNGKTVYVGEGGEGQGRPAELHERTAIGKHKSGTHYLRASDAEDGKQIEAAAKHLDIKTEKRRSGASHFGRVGAYDHHHVSSLQDATAIHAHLKAGSESAPAKTELDKPVDKEVQPETKAEGKEKAPEKVTDESPSGKAIAAAEAVKGRDAKEMLGYSQTAHRASQEADRTGSQKDHYIAHSLHLAAEMSHNQATEDSDGYEDMDGKVHPPTEGNEGHQKAWLAHHEASRYHKGKAGDAKVPASEMNAALAKYSKADRGVAKAQGDQEDEANSRQMMKSYVEARLGQLDKQVSRVGGDKIALAALELRRQSLLNLDK